MYQIESNPRMADYYEERLADRMAKDEGKVPREGYSARNSRGRGDYGGDPGRGIEEEVLTKPVTGVRKAETSGLPAHEECLRYPTDMGRKLMECTGINQTSLIMWRTK